MGKAIGAVGVTLTLGVAAVSVLSGLLGAHAEAAALGVMGLGLFGLGRVFSTLRPRAEAATTTTTTKRGQATFSS